MTAPEVEAVARALYERMHDVSWDDAWELDRALFIECSRAAIEAHKASLDAQGLVIRPSVATEEMMAPVCDPHAEVYLSSQTLQGLWQAMIKAAPKCTT